MQCPPKHDKHYSDQSEALLASEFLRYPVGALLRFLGEENFDEDRGGWHSNKLIPGQRFKLFLENFRIRQISAEFPGDTNRFSPLSNINSLGSVFLSIFVLT